MTARRKYRELEPDQILEMDDIDLDEFSPVDEPATGRPYVAFKSRGKVDFPGLGAGAPGGGPNDRLPDLTSHYSANPDDSPAQAEAAFEGRGDLVDGLVDDHDGAGDEARRDDPPTAGDFQTVTKGERMARKQDELLMEEPAPDAAMAATEVPASAQEYPLSTCIIDAQGMIEGLNEDGAVQVCRAVHDMYGDQSDDTGQTILVPEGLSPDQLIMTEAVAMGLVAPDGQGSGDGGADQGEEAALRAPQKRRNFWTSLADAVRGKREPTIIERRLKALERGESEMLKANRDLMRIIHGQQAIIARALGIDDPEALESVEAEAAEEGVGALAQEAGTGTASEVRQPKRAKPKAKAEPEPEDELEEKQEEPEALAETEREELERLRARYAEEAEDQVAEVLDQVAEEFEEEPEPEPAALMAPRKFQRQRRAKRTAVAPPRKKARVQASPSTVLGGVLVVDSDREALR